MSSRADVIWAVVPVKEFARAKGRLAQALGPAMRARLARAMAEDVLSAMQHADVAERLCVVSDSLAGRDLALHRGATWFDEGRVAAASGLNGAVAGVASAAESRGATALLIVHADMPLLTPADIQHVVATWRALADGQRVVMARSRDGGTNILLVERPQSFNYHYGPGSHARHLAECARRGCVAASVDLPGAALDIDTEADFECLVAAAEERRCGGRTAALLDEIAMNGCSTPLELAS